MPKALAAGSEPETRPDGRGARASRFPGRNQTVGSDVADGGDDRGDPAPPVAGAHPAPGHYIRQCQEQLGVGPLVLVAEHVDGSGLAGELEQFVAVAGQERIVLLDHQAGVSASGEVTDQCSQTRRPGLALGAVAAGRVIDRLQ